jgi:hypothetical protein
MVRTRQRVVPASQSAPGHGRSGDVITVGGLPPVLGLERVQRDAFNNAELRANAQNILSLIHSMRPKNTTSTYEPKQREFQEFCRLQQYHDGDTVTEDKLLYFLTKSVTNRPLRAKSRKVDPDVPQDETRLAWRSVRSYITAITDLYRTQKARGMNTHPSPREDNVRDYLKSLQRRDAEQAKTGYTDKGSDTLLDGYTEQEFETICHKLWAHTASGPAESHLRTLVDLLLGHYMLTRGGDRRALELSDLFTFEFPGEGPTVCMPVIMTTRAGKTNQHGRLETAGALRNRKPLICVLSGLAFYLLFRWDLTEEPFPDFSRRPAWYDIRLITSSGGAGRTAGLSYNSQREWAARALSYAGINSQKKTHIGRSSGAKVAELKGVSEDQIRRAGRWNQEQMIGCYLNSLPRAFMRTMAGHPPQMGCFEIRRAGVAPPADLLSMIWPQLDQWHGRFGPGPGQINDLAAMGFTNLLFYLREVVLQDSAVLMAKFPNSPVWSHPVFQHPAYKPFAQQVAAFVQEEERPSQLAVLTQALPVLADYLNAIDARNEARVQELTAELRATKAQLIEAQSQQTVQLHGILSTGLTVHVQAAALAGPGASLATKPRASQPAGLGASQPAEPEPEPEPAQTKRASTTLLPAAPTARLRLAGYQLMTRRNNRPSTV